MFNMDPTAFVSSIQDMTTYMVLFMGIALFVIGVNIIAKKKKENGLFILFCGSAFLALFVYHLEGRSWAESLVLLEVITRLALTSGLLCGIGWVFVKTLSVIINDREHNKHNR